MTFAWYQKQSGTNYTVIFNYCLSEFIIDFIMGLSISTNWKGKSYDFILMIINYLTKMVHYKPIIVTINAPGLAKVIIDIIVHHYSISEIIVTDQGLLFILKFWSFLCYFLDIKRRLFITFHSQKND